MSSGDRERVEKWTNDMAVASFKSGDRRTMKYVTDIVRREANRNLGPRNADVDDIVQMTLLRLYTAVDGFDPGQPAHFVSWVRAIARHVCVDFIRQKHRVRYVFFADSDFLQEEDLSVPEDAENRFLEADAMGEVRRQLDPKDRDILDMVLSGSDNEEIGEAEHLKPGSVRSRLSRLRQTIRQILSGFEPEP